MLKKLYYTIFRFCSTFQHKFKVECLFEIKNIIGTIQLLVCATDSIAINFIIACFHWTHVRSVSCSLNEIIMKKMLWFTGSV